VEDVEIHLGQEKMFAVPQIGPQSGPQTSQPTISFRDTEEGSATFTFLSYEDNEALHIAKAKLTNHFRVTMLNAARSDTKIMTRDELYAYLDVLAASLDETIYDIKIHIPYFPLRYVCPADFKTEAVQDCLAAALEVWMT
jgi:hypothetical protein